jgi:hypothetical protein
MLDGVMSFFNVLDELKGGGGSHESCLPAEIRVEYFRITNQIRQTLLLWQHSSLRHTNGLRNHLFRSTNENA